MRVFDNIRELYKKEGLTEVIQGIGRWIIYRSLSQNRRNNYYTIIRYYKYKLEFDSVAKPKKRIYIDLDKVVNKDTSQIFPGKKGIGYIQDGDWDKNKQPIDEIELYEIYDRRFIQNKPWSETGLLETAKEIIKNKNDYHNCTNIEEVLEHRCLYIDKLYNKINNEGYKSQKEAHDFLDEKKHTDYTPLEILVTISRGGEILFYTGHNRMMLAKIIGIDEIPVQIMARHKQWQRIREQVAAGKFEGDLDCDWKLQEHPDLQDVL